ncbi:hypothetical protein AAKU55_005811 [Oxalobacteraceae bacterium GrIS 1.11]
MAAKLIAATVAARKTVMVQGLYFGPGREVRLPADEVAELRARGFLVDPGGPDAPQDGPGPDFDAEADAAPVVTVTEA